MSAKDDIDSLRQERDRLIALLDANRIEWRISDSTSRWPTPEPREDAQSPPASQSAPMARTPQLSTPDKIALFRKRFAGRADVYALRWESSHGKSGYSPACLHDRFARPMPAVPLYFRSPSPGDAHPELCHKPMIKCSECPHRKLLPLSDAALYHHLAGNHVIGVYPLLADDTCHFVAIDLDDAGWRDDARALYRSCSELNIPALLEISRSGNGAHLWIFFASAVTARDARQLASALISRTCASAHQLALSSYDRLFPNQDRQPKGGFGNLIALPLQRRPRQLGFSTFVDENLQPYPDPWEALQLIRPLSAHDLETLVLRAAGGTHPLDVAFVEEEDAAKPWKRKAPTLRIPGPLPKALHVTRANTLYFEKSELTQPLANRLIRLAASQNPEYYRAQAMRMSVWNKPRVIGCADNHPNHIALPRGCLGTLQDLLSANDVELHVADERNPGTAICTDLSVDLRPDQEQALSALLRHEDGVLSAPTAFGKTVVAAAIIHRRQTNTLILVHRTALMKQWRDRLQATLGIDDAGLGTIGGGRSRPTGHIDIAVMQSVVRQGLVDELVGTYGQVIVDECHHLSVVSFESVMKASRARFVLGLTATPFRRDGQQPIIFMQCGPMRFQTRHVPTGPERRVVISRTLTNEVLLPADAPIQQIFKVLAEDRTRTDRIAGDARDLASKGRRVLVLTERTDHLLALRAALEDFPRLFVLHGRLSQAQRDMELQRLQGMDEHVARVVLATGRLIGEGFDHPPLDTLVLAMPISWRGTLQQYAGRLHRQQPGKTTAVIYDYFDSGSPTLLRMWQRRQHGYRSMDYEIRTDEDLFVDELVTGTQSTQDAASDPLRAIHG